MNSTIEFSSTTMFLLIAAILVLILLLIVAFRRWLYQKTNDNLADKYKGRQWRSPLEGRNKYPDANVFQYSNSFFLFGLAISLGLTFLALNWTSYEEEIYIPKDALLLEEDIEIEPPRSDVKPPPPPPPPPPVIEEVPNEQFEEEDEIEFLDQSIDENTEVSESTLDVPKEIAKKGPPAPPPPPPPMPEPEVEEIFQVVEEMPRFKGCEHESDKEKRKICADQKMLEFVYSNIQYPSLARENGIAGTVVLRFYVDTDGSVRDISVVKEVGGGCGAEGLRIVNLMNEGGVRWIPGKQRGRKVKVWFNLPIRFKLI